MHGAVADRSLENEDTEALGEYVAWPEQHLKDSDPLRSIWLPQGVHPDLIYDEWHEWRRQNRSGGEPGSAAMRIVWRVAETASEGIG